MVANRLHKIQQPRIVEQIIHNHCKVMAARNTVSCPHAEFHR